MLYGHAFTHRPIIVVLVIARNGETELISKDTAPRFKFIRGLFASHTMAEWNTTRCSLFIRFPLGMMMIGIFLADITSEHGRNEGPVIFQQ